MNNVSSEIKHREERFLPHGRETRSVRAMFNKNNDNMSISCRGNETHGLSAAVRVPDNRAASIIPFPTAASLSLPTLAALAQ